MSVEQIGAVLLSALALSLLLFMFVFCVPALRLDIFRQKMFALRDELFDWAASGKIAFDDPAYRLLRDYMNGVIQYGHRITFFQLCTTVMSRRLLGQRPDASWHRKWKSALASVRDQQTKQQLIEFHDRVFVLFMNRLIFGSPVLFTVMLIVAAAMALNAVAKGAWRLATCSSLATLYGLAAEATVTKIVNTELLEEQAALSLA